MTKNLSPKIEQIMNEIIMDCPNAIFGGSIALLAAGLIDRKISDIDLIFSENNYNNNEFKNIFLKKNYDVFQTSSPWSDTDNVFDGRKIVRQGISVNGVKICCFVIPDDLLKFSTKPFLDRKIKVHDLEYIIKTKIEFMHKNTKHKVDLDQIIRNLVRVWNEY